METKFHGRRISIDEVLKSINVNFLFFRSIFLLGQFLLSCFFCAVLLYTQKEITQIIERWKFVTVGGTREVYAVARLLSVLQFYTCLIY